MHAPACTVLARALPASWPGHRHTHVCAHTPVSNDNLGQHSGHPQLLWHHQCLVGNGGPDVHRLLPALMRQASTAGLQTPNIPRHTPRCTGLQCCVLIRQAGLLPDTS